MSEPRCTSRSVIQAEAVAAAVRQAIRSTWPRRFAPEQLGDDQLLGAGGLGLDSVDVVELIMVCEHACGTSVSDALFAAAPLTVGRLITDLRGTV